jgi:hypothetical protein
VAVLQVLQRLLVVLDSALELLDVLGAPLAEGSLSLPVALLALFRGRIYLVSLGQSYLRHGDCICSRVCDRLCASAEQARHRPLGPALVMN